MARAAKPADPDASPARKPAPASTSVAGPPPGPDAGSQHPRAAHSGARPWGGAAGAWLKALWNRWWEVDTPRLSAGVAFYTILSLAPLLILVVAVGSWWVGADATRHYLTAEIARLVGDEGGAFVDKMVAARDAETSFDGWAAWIGMLITVIGATATFVELQYALDRVFGDVPRQALSALLRARALSFGLVLGTGFLLAVSLVLSAMLTMLVDRGAHDTAVAIGAIGNEWLSLVVITVAFAAVLRVLPDRPPHGRQIWIGAITSATLFEAGKYLIGWYVTRFALGSAYGAAGTIVVVMVWIYFSTAIFLTGAVVASLVAPATRAQRAQAHESGHVLRANQEPPHGSHAHGSLPSGEARARRRSMRLRWPRA